MKRLRLLKPLRLLIAAVLACCAFGAVASSAQATGTAFFPSTPTAVQITRDISMQEAAQDGILTLGAKGGFIGDAVLLELQGQSVHAPITVTLHVEMTVEASHSAAEREAIRDLVPYLDEKTEAELNRPNYKTPRGEPINFVLDYRYREPGDPATPNYDQVKIVDPAKDLGMSNPNEYRSGTEGLGVPNAPSTVGATFGTNDLNPVVLAHESLHLIGLDDRYTDVYQYNGHQIPLPESGMTEAALAAYLKGLKPPVPPPPAGEIGAKNTAGTKRCDIMGAGFELACRKISKRDLRWLESQAGVEVETKPGEVLLNKDSSSQNLGVAYPTTAWAAPGETTVAPGVAVYCVDHTKLPPSESNFDVGPPLSAVPGLEGAAKLLELNAQLQTSLDGASLPMQSAIWNQTDGSAPEGLIDPNESPGQAQELLTKAGVAVNTSGEGPAHLDDPNAGSAATGAVDASGAVLPSTPAEPAAAAPSIRFVTAELLPKTVAPGHPARISLILGTSGSVAKLALRLQGRAGHHWRALKTLPDHELADGSKVLPLHLGRLRPGKYRLVVTVYGPSGEPFVKKASLTVRGEP
jgi:hypothetical protein